MYIVKNCIFIRLVLEWTVTARIFIYRLLFMGQAAGKNMGGNLASDNFSIANSFLKYIFLLMEVVMLVVVKQFTNILSQLFDSCRDK